MVSVMLREPCPPTKLHIAVLPPLGPNPERNTGTPLNRANLKASYQSLQKSTLMPTRVGGTRWVSHILKALDHFVRGHYAPIVQHLEQIQSPDSVGIRGEQKAKVKQLYQTATTKSVVKYVCLLFDVLQHLSTLSYSLQRSSLGTQVS